MPFFLLVTFITTLLCNIFKHFFVNGVSKPLVRSKMAITLELKLCGCQILAEEWKDKKKVSKVQLLL